MILRTKFRKSPASADDDFAFYTYYHRNRLTAVTFRVGASSSSAIKKQVEYGYDAFDRQTSRTETDNLGNYLQARYAYDGHDIVLEQYQYDEVGTAYFTFSNFWLPAGENSLLLAREYISGTLTLYNIDWYLADAQGTYRDVIGTTSAADPELLYRRSHSVYDSYGNITGVYDNWGGYLGTTPPSRYTWAGLELDLTTGLLAADRRFYDPQLGKWINHDPIGFAGGQWNVSMYVGNDPVNGIDPSGLQRMVPLIGNVDVPAATLQYGDYQQKLWQEQEKRRIEAEQQKLRELALEAIRRQKEWEEKHG